MSSSNPSNDLSLLEPRIVELQTIMLENLKLKDQLATCESRIEFLEKALIDVQQVLLSMISPNAA